MDSKVSKSQPSQSQAARRGANACSFLWGCTFCSYLPSSNSEEPGRAGKNDGLQKGGGVQARGRRPHFRLSRYTKKHKRPSGSSAIHKKRPISLRGFSDSPQRQRHKKETALKKQSLACSQLTCEERRGRRHVVPEKETGALGSEFTRAKPGLYTSTEARRRRRGISGVISLGADSLPVGARGSKGAPVRTRGSGATLYRKSLGGLGRGG